MLALYIDPGTGSMLFSIVIGLIATATFGIRALAIKIKYGFNKEKAEENTANTIPYVIFSDHKRYWNVFKGICEEFNKRGIDVVYYTLSSDDPALSCGLEHIKAEYLGEGNKPYTKLNFLKADIVIATTPGLDVYQWKRSKNVKCYVHIPHTVDDISGYRMFGLDHYDVVLTTGDNQIESIRKIEALRPSINRKELVTVGSTTLDNLLIQYKETERPAKNDKTVVLVAPSWGKSGILSKYGEKFLSALERTDFEVIVRPHPQTVVSEANILNPLKEKFSSFEWNFDNDNFRVLDKADILITDFSGIIFDYSLIFNKPIIYADTSFDTAPYDADWLDEEYWSLRVLPKLGLKLEENSFDDIEALINKALSSSTLKEGREEIRRSCWEYPGESFAKSTEYLIEKEKELTKTK